MMLLLVLMPLSDALANDSLPPDVTRYIEKREGCDHMRGEIPPAGEVRRRRELQREIDRLCQGTDKELLRLKKKYSADVLVMRRLDEIDPQIEAPAAAGATGHR